MTVFLDICSICNYLVPKIRPLYKKQRLWQSILIYEFWKFENMLAQCNFGVSSEVYCFYAVLKGKNVITFGIFECLQFNKIPQLLWLSFWQNLIHKSHMQYLLQYSRRTSFYSKGYKIHKKSSIKNYISIYSHNILHSSIIYMKILTYHSYSTYKVSRFDVAYNLELIKK